MGKKSHPDYLLTDKEEHALILEHAFNSLQKLATMHVGETPLPQKELKSFLNAKKVVDGIVNFKNQEQLKKDWKNVNWEDNPERLAGFVVSSGIKEVIASCPLDWSSIRNTISTSSPRQNLAQNEPLWLVEKMVQNFNDFTPYLATSRKASSAPNRIAENFWNTLLTTEKVNFDTPLKNRHFSEPKTLNLFELSVLYKNDNLTKKFPLTKAINSQNDAELALLCITSGVSNHLTYNQKLQLRIIGRCLKFSPDMSRKFKYKTASEIAQEKMSSLSKGEKSEFGYSDFDLQYISYVEKQENKITEITLADLVFDYLTQNSFTMNAPLAEVFIRYTQNLSVSKQEEFIKETTNRLGGFPFNNPQFLGRLFSVLDKNVVLSLFKQSFAVLAHDPDDNFIPCFLNAKCCFDKQTLIECGRIYLSENNNFCGYLPLDNFELLFDKSCRPQASSLASLLMSDEDEKNSLSKALWLQDMENDVGARPSRTPRQM